MNFRRTGLLIGALLCSVGAFADLPKEHLIPGGLALFELGQSKQPPVVRYNNQQVLVYAHGGANGQAPEWTAAIGIPLDAKPGQSSATYGNQKLTFTIGSHKYAEQRLQVQNKHVNPDPKAMERINTEAARMGKIFKSFNKPEAQTWPQMIWPAEGPLSSPFGLRRFFNGEERNPHTGLDIAAKRGSRIVAPADGVIRDTGDFYFNGNTVMIDHGQGMITMFCHLDRIDVKPGQVVHQGDMVGIVGATGRATGPHLHWTLSMNNARVDPRLVLPPHPSEKK
ncbi:peptidoglycan DD-metalloendopeptidase family protein [Parathalassolituus penaei]|uniref:Peptidoglycan DD-metalloendopeptidase family protein n=1 Tax=Parathalassolituus penaei TaxID=2997323 RepID=A0A9X3EFE7_9GAMM|nr:peptidoglycan DD-metalloendopeptidase family protein [Parathalassolituus penaei]MCY0966618.1 peptidoglycan DD-metalloendopeptidase family protein [Parathalassolituus penaei]